MTGRGRQNDFDLRCVGVRSAMMLFSLCAPLILNLIPGEALAGPSRAYIVVDAATGQTLDSQRSGQKMHPASLTKMMTLYLTFEAIAEGRLNLDQNLKTSRYAASMPRSKLGLRTGRRITVRDAIRAAAVFSANDASVVLAEAIAGSEEAFAKRMTQKARVLGMRNTQFKNASGLTKSGQYSTVEDMAILSRRLILDFPENYIVFGRKSVKVHGATRRATNRLLRSRRDVDGLKTGYTSAAGFNLAATARKGDRRVIAVLMGERSRVNRDRAVSRLLDRGFELQRQFKKRDLLFAGYAPRPRLRPKSTFLDKLEVAVVAAGARQRINPPTGLQTARIDRAMAKRTALKGDFGGWSVQVGAYYARPLALRQLDTVASLSAPALLEARRRVERASLQKTTYRARFGGLTKGQAKEACDWLKRRQVQCALVPPQGWRT